MLRYLFAYLFALRLYNRFTGCNLVYENCILHFFHFFFVFHIFLLFFGMRGLHQRWGNWNPRSLRCGGRCVAENGRMDRHISRGSAGLSAKPNRRWRITASNCHPLNFLSDKFILSTTFDPLHCVRIKCANAGALKSKCMQQCYFRPTVGVQ